MKYKIISFPSFVIAFSGEIRQRIQSSTKEKLIDAMKKAEVLDAGVEITAIV